MSNIQPAGSSLSHAARSNMSAPLGIIPVPFSVPGFTLGALREVFDGVLVAMVWKRPPGTGLRGVFPDIIDAISYELCMKK